MKVNVKNLLEVLNAVNAAVTNKEILEQSDSFIFLKNGTVCSFNDEIAIHAKCPLKIKGSVKAKDMLSLLSKLRDTEVSIKTKGNELIVKGKSTKAGLAMIHDITLPLDDVDDPEKWTRLPNDFETALKSCIPACSTNMNKPALACIHLDGNVAEATDGIKMSRYVFDKKNFKTEVLFPVHAATIIANKPVKYFSTTTGWIHFTDKSSITYSCRVFSEKFPDLDRFANQKGTKIKFPSKMIEMLDTVAVFSQNEIANREMVQIEMGDSKCTISSKNENGWVSEKFKIDEDYDFGFMIDPNLFKNLLKTKGSIEITDNLMSIRNENFTHVLALIK